MKDTVFYIPCDNIPFCIMNGYFFLSFEQCEKKSEELRGYHGGQGKDYPSKEYKPIKCTVSFEK